ncbi:MAG: hypothetical protein VR69_04285 [Peptococcaceae bacterium BRH_c4b]|nr:MAG: hypothetical protein VR69_04285 [Peptococcaceae bacterium BRH_c4b]
MHTKTVILCSGGIFLPAEGFLMLLYCRRKVPEKFIEVLDKYNGIKIIYSYKLYLFSKHFKQGI